MTTQQSNTSTTNEPDFFKTRMDSPVEGKVSPSSIQSGAVSNVVVIGVRRLSTISEQDHDKVDTDLSSLQGPLGGSEWGGSSYSLCSANKYNNSSSHFTSFESHQPDSGEDCAALLLACLYCRFYDMVVMLPDTCERAVSRCFPSFKYRNASSEQGHGGDCCSCNVELDCSCCSACQETAELLELAMEISEVCFR